MNRLTKALAVAVVMSSASAHAFEPVKVPGMPGGSMGIGMPSLGALPNLNTGGWTHPNADKYQAPVQATMIDYAKDAADLKARQDAASAKSEADRVARVEAASREAEKRAEASRQAMADIAVEREALLQAQRDAVTVAAPKASKVAYKVVVSAADQVRQIRKNAVEAGVKEDGVLSFIAKDGREFFKVEGMEHWREEGKTWGGGSTHYWANRVKAGTASTTAAPAPVVSGPVAIYGEAERSTNVFQPITVAPAPVKKVVSGEERAANRAASKAAFARAEKARKDAIDADLVRQHQSEVSRVQSQYLADAEAKRVSDLEKEREAFRAAAVERDRLARDARDAEAKRLQAQYESAVEARDARVEAAEAASVAKEEAKVVAYEEAKVAKEIRVIQEKLVAIQVEKDSEYEEYMSNPRVRWMYSPEQQQSFLDRAWKESGKSSPDAGRKITQGPVAGNPGSKPFDRDAYLRGAPVKVWTPEEIAAAQKKQHDDAINSGNYEMPSDIDTGLYDGDDVNWANDSGEAYRDMFGSNDSGL